LNRLEEGKGSRGLRPQTFGRTEMARPLSILAALTVSLLWHPFRASASRGDLAPAASEPVVVWRFWSPVSGKHFYTTDAVEKDKLLSQYADVWTYEGVAFRAFSSADEPNVAGVYRFWSESLQSHFYTLDAGERDKLLRDYPTVWTDEGIAFYAYPAGRQPGGTIAVQRFWAGSLEGHFYTTSDRERFKLTSAYGAVWQYEGVAWYACPPDNAAAGSIVKGPYLRSVTADAATILWETDTAASSRVDYSTTRAGLSWAFDPSLTTRHEIALTGLTPATACTYTVTSGIVSSPPGSFTTAPAAGQPFRFAVYGDSRSNPTLHARVVYSIIASAPAVVFHTGDLVGDGTDYQAWQTEFFGPARALLRDVPVVPVPGNHEHAGAGPLWFYYFFDLPLDEGWWALTWGNVRFLGLNTNVAYTADSPQHTWLMQEFASDPYRAATWHVVLFHHPAFSSTVSYSGDPALRSDLVPLFRSHGVDVVFQGHSHAYERYQDNGICYIVTGGGGAPLYALAPATTPPLRQAGLSVHHYCTADVDPARRTLLLRAVDLRGRSFDTVTLSK
jgi:hypothetical protein